MLHKEKMLTTKCLEAHVKTVTCHNHILSGYYHEGVHMVSDFSNAHSCCVYCFPLLTNFINVCVCSSPRQGATPSQRRPSRGNECAMCASRTSTTPGLSAKVSPRLSRVRSGSRPRDTTDQHGHTPKPDIDELTPTVLSLSLSKLTVRVNHVPYLCSLLTVCRVQGCSSQDM